MLLAIDPGPVMSAYVVWDGVTIYDSALVPNKKLLGLLAQAHYEYAVPDFVVIEMIASYGMAVGASIFNTCVWIGRFIQAWEGPYQLLYRKDVKMHLCESMRAKDSNIKQALIDRFALNASNHGKGTKDNPSIFYGFKKDIWAAMAVAVTAWDNPKTEN